MRRGSQSSLSLSYIYSFIIFSLNPSIRLIFLYKTKQRLERAWNERKASAVHVVWETRLNTFIARKKSFVEEEEQRMMRRMHINFFLLLVDV